LAVCVLATGISVVRSHGDEPKTMRGLMERKLEQSQKVLKGIALGDFDMIGKNAEELIQASKDAEWKALKTPRYAIYSNDFRQAAEALAEKAQAKNLDGATLAYMEMTMTCVKCHKHLREERKGAD